MWAYTLSVNCYFVANDFVIPMYGINFNRNNQTEDWDMWYECATGEKKVSDLSFILF